MKHLLNIVLCAITLLFGVASCSDEPKSSTVYGEFWLEMVTYMGYNDGTAQFQLIPRSSDSPTNLSAKLQKEPDLKPGQRLMLHYQLTSTEGEVVARGYTPATTDSLRQASIARIDTVKREPVKMRAMWRTGNYLNMRLEIEPADNKQLLYLLADKSTLSKDTVEMFLVHNTLNQHLYGWTPIYASFYVGAATKRSSCRAIRLHFNDAITPVDSLAVFPVR